MSKNATKVSLTRDEAEKLLSLWKISHGAYDGSDKTGRKLAAAIERMNESEAV